MALFHNVLPADLNGMLSKYLEPEFKEEILTLEEYNKREAKFDEELRKILREQDEAKRKEEAQELIIIRGLQGARGPVGPVGCIGPIGPIGIQGAQGCIGVQGAQGTQGPVGYGYYGGPGFQQPTGKTTKKVALLTITIGDLKTEIPLFYCEFEATDTVVNSNLTSNFYRDFLKEVDEGRTVILHNKEDTYYSTRKVIWLSAAKEIRVPNLNFVAGGRLGLRILDWIRRLSNSTSDNTFIRQI